MEHDHPYHFTFVFKGPPDLQEKALNIVKHAFAGRIEVRDEDEWVISEEPFFGEYPLTITIFSFDTTEDRRIIKNIMNELKAITVIRKMIARQIACVN